MDLRHLGIADMDAAADVHRVAFDERLPWLAGRHTSEGVRRYFRETVFPACTLWGAWEATRLIGIIAFRDGWIDQLYVLPDAQGRGTGSALLQVAMSSQSHLQLWTFQRNHAARRFYEARGFALVRETDGASNHEKEPDALYSWEP
jgi:GNAT superfamily N-acetyltransferase